MPLLLANVAVPVLFPQPLLMIATLLLVVPVETLLLRRSCPCRTKDVLAANVYSTLWGIPVAYLVLALFGILHARGEPPWAGVGFMSRVASTDDHHWWILPLAMFVVLVPCYVLSVVLESRFLARILPAPERNTLTWAVARANFFSYLVLLGLDSVWFSYQI